MPQLLVILIVIIVAAFFFWNRSKNNLSEHELLLIKRCHGNEPLAESLINYEINKNPTLSKANAAKNAIQSLIRDNRY